MVYWFASPVAYTLSPLKVAGGANPYRRGPFWQYTQANQVGAIMASPA